MAALAQAGRRYVRVVQPGPELEDADRVPAAAGMADTQAAQASDPARTATQAGEATRDPSGELPAGIRLGHFKIDRKLGAGGMGEVYLATDLALDRPVA